jgi:DNA invertase Pin-like site-specific DNA recombinase
MKQLFAYIRVSTAKQGQGVSLQEQRAAIERFAARTGAVITQWFEERVTAAKTGRPEFARMVKLLKAGKASGVVIHKIDRSTRNYRDWADIDELIEGGIEVHFANDDLDLRSRGGRLAADIQVVVAVDYIRNLREEALKGIHGRLKQGILPHGAPIGYLDRGAGKPKEIDPVRGPLIRRLFELYGQGGCSLRTLTFDADRMGLRNRNGNPLRLPQVQALLRNPFYAGVIRSTRYGLFKGAHEALVPSALFDRVQALLDGKHVRRTKRFAFPFRRLLHCKTCGRSLVGSERKGFVYYRCQTIDCPTTSVREDAVDLAITEFFGCMTLTEDEAQAIENELTSRRADEEHLQAVQRTALEEALSAVNARTSRLTDLLIDGTIDAAAHREKRDALVLEKVRLEERLSTLGTSQEEYRGRLRKILGLARCPQTLYKMATADKKRELLQIAISDCIVTGKTLEISANEPFATIAKRHFQQSCGPHWNTPRTFSLETLNSWAKDCSKEQAERLERFSLPEIERVVA